MTRRILLNERMHGLLLHIVRKELDESGDSDTRKLLNILRCSAIGPLKMLLYCPECFSQHIDASGDEHWVHVCHNCQHKWKPAKIATCGVEKL